MGCDEYPLDPTRDHMLYEVEVAPVSLADRYTYPPFSVLDRRAGAWQDRKRRWLELGIQSEVGRQDNLAFQFRAKDPAFQADLEARGGGTSVFDPVVCELVYRWFTPPGAAVLDPFCGGSVRGVVAGRLGRHYTGTDIREEQIAANRAQTNLCGSGTKVEWVLGDAVNLDGCLLPNAQYDLVFSCPPYGDLEVYSDDPRDLSNWPWTKFLSGHQTAITDACRRLRSNRYAVWVVGDLRADDGTYRGFHHRTVEAFTAAGLKVINEAVVLSPLGTIPVRAKRPFDSGRKLANAHQHMLVFVKGDPDKAAAWAAREPLPTLAEKPIEGWCPSPDGVLGAQEDLF